MRSSYKSRSIPKSLALITPPISNPDRALSKLTFFKKFFYFLYLQHFFSNLPGLWVSCSKQSLSLLFESFNILLLRHYLSLCPLQQLYSFSLSKLPILNMFHNWIDSSSLSLTVWTVSSVPKLSLTVSLALPVSFPSLLLSLSVQSIYFSTALFSSFW